MSQLNVHFADDNENIKQVEELEYLTEEQILDICSIFMLPFNNFQLVLDSVYEDVKKISYDHLVNIKIYPSMFEEYKQHLFKKYLSTLIDPKTPIGAITSDAISQQATQALLNTFHSVGTKKSGGADGIRENIGISSKRKVFYSIIHMKNSKLSYLDVMKMKSQFIGLSLDKLFLHKPESIVINISEHSDKYPFTENNDNNLSIFKGSNYWWYSYVPLNDIYDKRYPIKRTCLRLKFDLQKLYEYKITTSNIAEFINKWIFQITIPKKSSSNRETIEKKILCVPSPTFLGIVDLFIKEMSDDNDHLLISLLHTDEFKKMIISGIDEIDNFYAVSTSVNRLIRDVAETNRFEEKKGISGMWVYLNDNRFMGIPYVRIIELFKKCGIKFEIPHYTNIESYENDYTDIPFEYHSHKSICEKRSLIHLKAYLYEDMKEHVGPSYIVPYNSKKDGRIELTTRYLMYTDNPNICNGNPCFNSSLRFQTSVELSSYIMKYGGSIVFEIFKYLFDEDTFNKSFQYLNSKGEVYISFAIMQEKRYCVYSFKYIKRHFVENKYYTYKKLDESFDICACFLTSGKEYDGILADKKKFKNRISLIEYFNKLEGEINYKTLEEWTTEADKYKEFFEKGNENMRIINVEITDPKEEIKYVQIALFRMNYIKYSLHINLDYVNSGAVTESLESVINKQFSIPYYYANKNGYFLLDALRKPKIYVIESIKEKPEMKILIKSKMFITDRFDFIGQSNRSIKLYFIRNTDKNMNEEQKREILDAYLKDKDIKLSKQEYESILEINKLTPYERLLAFIKERSDESDINYVYAETSGSNLDKIISNKNIQSNRVICNNFYQVFQKFGLEALRNLLAYDMIGMINGSGYISVEYMNLSSNVTTHNGVNQMTSEGISCQKRGVLDIITFDNAAKYIHIAALAGEIQEANSTSTCIFLGKPFKMGTGSVDITIDKTRLHSLNRPKGDYDGFLKYVGYSKSRNELYLSDESQELILIPDLISGKFSKPLWILKEVIKKDIFFYIKQGTEKMKISSLPIIEPHKYLNSSKYLKKIKGSFI